MLENSLKCSATEVYQYFILLGGGFKSCQIPRWFYLLMIYLYQLSLMVVSYFSLFTPKIWRRWVPILTNAYFFQRGWFNHQLYCLCYLPCVQVHHSTSTFSFVYCGIAILFVLRCWVEVAAYGLENGKLKCKAFCQPATDWKIYLLYQSQKKQTCSSH